MFGDAKISYSSGDSRLLSALCYAGFLLGIVGVLVSFLVYVTQKGDRYARFHALQSMGLTAFYLVASIVLMIPAMLLFFLTFGMAMFVIMPIFLLLGLAMLGASLYFAYLAYNGRAFKLPILCNFALKHA